MFSTLRFGFLLEMKEKLWLCSVVLAGASHCCSHIIRLCTHAENMVGSYVLFVVQDFWEGFTI